MVRHMDKDTRDLVLDIEKHGNAKQTIGSVTFCKSSASLTVGNITIHIPWTELAIWQTWLATEMEES